VDRESQAAGPLIIVDSSPVRTEVTGKVAARRQRDDSERPPLIYINAARDVGGARSAPVAFNGSGA